VPRRAPSGHRDPAQLLRTPSCFAQYFLRENPWEMQAQILDAVGAFPRVAVKACHASSKTRAAAQAVLWWITRYKDGIAITTAPTWQQVQLILWGEIHKAVGRSRWPYPKPNQADLKLAPGNYAVGWSTNEGVRFQGVHGNHVLFVLDEAPSIQPEIWEAIEGARAGGDVRIVALGNPTIPGGPFYDAFASNRDGWKTIAIDAFDTPNFACLRELARGDGERMIELLASLADDHPAITHAPRPYLVTPKWAKEKLREWGTNSPLWQAKVRGQFPEQAEDALISLAWLEAAKARAIPTCESSTATSATARSAAARWG
jgi:phage terminase large subunit